MAHRMAYMAPQISRLFHSAVRRYLCDLCLSYRDLLLALLALEAGADTLVWTSMHQPERLNPKIGQYLS